MFRLGRRKQDEKLESFVSASCIDLVRLFSQSVSLESEIRCGPVEASRKALQQSQHEVQRRSQMLAELSARESDPNIIAEIGESDDALGHLLSSIVCSLGLYDRAKEMDYEKELQCFTGLLCTLCQGTDRSKRKVCNRVLSLVADAALFSRLLNLEMPFWIKYNTVCVVAAFVENDPQLFLPLVARTTSLLPALCQLLRCSEHEVSLRDAVLVCLKLISSPMRLQAAGSESHDDDSIPAQLLRLLVFENCLEELIQIVKGEGGAHFSWTSLKHQAVVALVMEVAIEPESSKRPIPAPPGAASPPSLGSLDVVLDCLITIRQLITSSAEALKYFEMNDLIVSLATALSFSAVREMSFAEVPSKFDKAGYLLLPPFARQRSDRRSVSLILERLLLEMSTILLTAVTHRRSTSEGKLNKLAQALATDQGASPSILHCVSNWITYFGILAFHFPESSCELSSDGQMFLSNCLATLHQFLQNDASRKYIVSFFAEKSFENLVERECRGTFSFSDFSTFLTAVLHPTSTPAEIIAGSSHVLCSLFRLCCCDCQDGPWTALAKGLALDVFSDLYPDISSCETHEALLSAFSGTNDIFSISGLVPLALATVISMQNGTTSRNSGLYGAVFCQLLVRAKRCVRNSENDRMASIVICQAAVVLLESLLLSRISLEPLQGTMECLVTHLLSTAPSLGNDGDLLGFSAHAAILAILSVSGGSEHIAEDASNIDRILLKHYNRFLLPTALRFEGAACCVLASSEPFPIDSQTGAPLFLVSSTFEQCVAQWAASSLLVSNFLIPPPAPHDNLSADVASRVSGSLVLQEGVGNAVFETGPSSPLFEIRHTQSFFAVCSHIKSHILMGTQHPASIPLLILSDLYKEANRIRAEDEILKSAERMRSSMNTEVYQAREAVETMTHTIARLNQQLEEAQALLNASTERERNLKIQLEQYELRIAANVTVWNAHRL